MSCNEYKCGIRVYLPSLDGKSVTEALKYFRNFLGEPEDVDEDPNTGEVEYFSYDGKIVPHQIDDTNNWCVDYVLSHSTDYDDEPRDLFITLKDVQKAYEILVKKFNGTSFEVLKENLVIFSYSWYNGCQEPIEMKGL